MKRLAFIFGVGISIVGTAGVVAPSVLVWLAEQSNTADAFYTIAVVRIAFGLILVRVAPASRQRKALRVLGYVIVVLGITTAVIGLLALGQARIIIEWWQQKGPTALRGVALFIVALGGFVAYACAPVRRAA